MGISETIFWASYEREQSRQDRAMQIGRASCRERV